ncbi:hypothetical protein M9458_049673, partial [Cirrhinus mrigala]
FSKGKERLIEEPARRTRRKKITAPPETEPVKRSTRNKGNGKAQELEEVAENIPEPKEDIGMQDSAVVKIPFSEHLSVDSLLNAGVSPSRESGLQMTPQGSSRTLVRRSLVGRRSLEGLRHSVAQEVVRRARRSFLKKKATLGNSICSSSAS